LQQHGVYFKKSAAPVKKILFSMMGFWVNVHPSFASSYVFRAEIVKSIQEKCNESQALLKTINLAQEFHEPNIFLERRKLNNAPVHAADGTTSTIDMEAFVMYANVDDFARSTTLITRISAFKTPSSRLVPLFIPMELKYKNPKQFSNYLAKQNNFLIQHRNIVTVVVVPTAMDYKEADELDIYSSIKNLAGVYRCDPTHWILVSGIFPVIVSTTPTFATGSTNTSSPCGKPSPVICPRSRPSPRLNDFPKAVEPVVLLSLSPPD
jgi:hypothetical protein